MGGPRWELGAVVMPGEGHGHARVDRFPQARGVWSARGRRAEDVTGRLAGRRVTPWLGKKHSGGTGNRVWIVLVEVLR